MALNVQGAYRTNKGGVSAEVLIGDAWEPVDFDRAGNPEWAMIDLAAFQGIRVVDNNLPDNLIEFRSTDGSRVIVHEIE